MPNFFNCTRFFLSILSQLVSELFSYCFDMNWFNPSQVSGVRHGGRVGRCRRGQRGGGRRVAATAATIVVVVVVCCIDIWS
jgi:hypothetical protein